MELEDNIRDVCLKAQRGLKLSTSELLARSGLAAAQWEQLLDGNGKEGDWQSVAAVLQLKGRSLAKLAAQKLDPPPVELPGLVTMRSNFPLPGYPEMQVNCHLVHDPQGSALLFDSGTDAELVQQTILKQKLDLKQIFLTHGHQDHVQALPALQRAHPSAQAWAAKEESVAGTRRCAAQMEWSCGALKVQAFDTPGHTSGGMSYLVEGLAQPLFFTGDAVFSGSIGGIRNDYQSALERIRRCLRQLPANCLLCPGHGPNTTVAFELEWHPFL